MKEKTQTAGQSAIDSIPSFDNYDTVVVTRNQPQLIRDILHRLPDYYSYEPTIQWYCSQSLKPSFTTIAVLSRDGSAVGVALLSSINDVTLEVVTIAVLPFYQRRGLGTALMKHAELEARRRNKTFLLLKTVGPSQNENQANKSFQFFRKQNYAMLAEYDFLWQDYYCAIMCKKLDSESIFAREEKRSSNAGFKIEQCKSNQGKVVRGILSSLPEYFRVEQAIQEYCSAAIDRRYSTYVATAENAKKAGFAMIVMNCKSTAEIWVMGVMPEFQRQGVGTRLLETVHQECRTRGCEYVLARTIGPSDDNENYLKTLSFYLDNGYSMVEESDEIWKGSYCAFMVKKL